MCFDSLCSSFLVLTAWTLLLGLCEVGSDVPDNVVANRHRAVLRFPLRKMQHKKRRKELNCRVIT